MGKEIITQVQETQRVPNRIYQSKAKHPKTHINQINKDQTQRKNSKSSKGEKKKQITHKGIPKMIAADLSVETLQARRELARHT